MKSLRYPLSVVLIALAGAAPADELRSQAVRESVVPIRAESHWNERAHQFIYAPSFDFRPVAGATRYRFTLRSANKTVLAFEAAAPTAPLSPVWADVPVGTTTLKVESVDLPGVVGTREFHRAAVFRGPYGKAVVPCAESARIGLDSVMHEPFVQSWLTTGRPDSSYPLYRYSSKILGSLMSGCALYAGQTPRPADADNVLNVGRRAGDFLMSISGAPGTPLEFMPPTYHDATPTERENDRWTMMMSPAEAGQGYLDLYAATREMKYLDAARRIGATYAKLQSPAGTWSLKVDNQTGRPLADLDLIPAVVITFLDRLVSEQSTTELKPTLDRAVAWMMANPVRTFDWRAQFDDAKVRGPYQNLAKHEACEFATYLFRHAKDDPKYAGIATELLRFAEDQFVTWEAPPDLPGRSAELDPKVWITPCSTEQYAMFEPISGSSAFMIVAYVRGFEVTGDRLMLAKAESLANALTAAQETHHGRYPTRMVPKDLAYWINSSINTARAMRLLAESDGPLRE